MGKINDKYVIRMPAVIMPDGHEVIPQSINTEGLADMGSLTWFSTTTYKGAKTIVEGSVISGDIFVGRGSEWPPKLGDTSEDQDLVVGRGLDWPPHKHDYEEIFTFWGGEQIRTIFWIWERMLNSGWARTTSLKKLNLVPQYVSTFRWEWPISR